MQTMQQVAFVVCTERSHRFHSWRGISAEATTIIYDISTAELQPAAAAFYVYSRVIIPQRRGLFENVNVGALVFHADCREQSQSNRRLHVQNYIPKFGRCYARFRLRCINRMQ